MALGISFSVLDDAVVGTKRNRFATVTLDDSYPIGGEPVTAAQFGFAYIERIIFDGPFVDPDTADLCVVPHFDKANSKLQMFWGEDGAALDEVPDTTDLSAFSGRVVVVGW